MGGKRVQKEDAVITGEEFQLTEQREKALMENQLGKRLYEKGD